MGRQRVRVIVAGRVQGVFFRASTQEEAQKLGLSGWVRNLPDGGVEAVLEGEAPAVQRMIAWLHHGPPLALVSRLRINEEEPLSDETGFTIKY